MRTSPPLCSPFFIPTHITLLLVTVGPFSSPSLSLLSDFLTFWSLPLYHKRLQHWLSFSQLISASYMHNQSNILISKALNHIPYSHSHVLTFNSVQFSSVAQSCPTLCNPMNCSTPGLPVHHHLPEFTQTHVHRAGDAIQPSHPLLSPIPPAPNPSQH